MNTYQKNQLTLQNGAITLYRREDHRDAKWQCRLRIKDLNKQLRRTTGETDLEAAKTRAVEMYHEYKYKKKHGVTIFKRPLNKVIDEYIDNLRKRVKSPAGNELFDFKALRSFV